MRAWTVLEPGEELREVELPDPEPTGTEVVVEVSHCGVCHSDVTLWKGLFDMGDRKVPIEAVGITRPLTLGHEIVGRVVRKGPAAKGVAIGERRIVFPWVGCGECAACQAEEDNMCQQSRSIGVRRAGGFGSQVVVPHPRHLVDPGHLDPALAATYACSGLTAYSAIRKVLPLQPGEPVVLIGAGGVGHAGIQILKALGHQNIIVVDVTPEKRSAALEAGARKAIDGTGEDVAGRLKAEAGGPVRTVVDFVNNSDTAKFAFASLGKGGRLIQVGMFGGAMTIPLMMMPQLGLTIQGSYVGNPKELRELVALAQSGKLAPIPVSTAPKRKVTEILERLKAGRVTGRIVLEGD